MERNGLHERSNDELRREDVKLFWKGFQSFRRENPGMEKDVEAKIKSTARSMDLDGSFEGAIEASMIFLYGVHLSRNLHPSIASKVPVQEFKVTDDENTSFCRAPVGKKIYGPGQFQAGLMNLLLTENGWTYHVVPWHDEKTATVSKFLLDWVIVDIAIGGPEEYAHDLFCTLKPKRKVTRALDEYRQIHAEQKIMSQRGYPELAAVHYHTSDFERRGLIWKQWFMDKYFPHWVEPTNDLTEKVRERRYSINSSKRPGFWQKIFG